MSYITKLTTLLLTSSFYSLTVYAVGDIATVEQAPANDYLRIICELEHFTSKPDPAKFEVIVIEQTSADIKTGSELLSNGYQDKIENIPAEIKIYRGATATLSQTQTAAENAQRLQALESAQTVNENQNYQQDNYVRVDGSITTLGNAFNFYHQNPTNHRRLRFDTDVRTKNSLSYYPYGNLYRCLETTVFTRPSSNTQSETVMEEQLTENVTE